MLSLCRLCGQPANANRPLLHHYGAHHIMWAKVRWPKCSIVTKFKIKKYLFILDAHWLRRWSHHCSDRLVYKANKVYQKIKHWIWCLMEVHFVCLTPYTNTGREGAVRLVPMVESGRSLWLLIPNSKLNFSYSNWPTESSERKLVDQQWPASKRLVCHRASFASLGPKVSLCTRSTTRV